MQRLDIQVPPSNKELMAKAAKVKRLSLNQWAVNTLTNQAIADTAAKEKR